MILKTDLKYGLRCLFNSNISPEQRGLLDIGFGVGYILGIISTTIVLWFAW